MGHLRVYVCACAWACIVARCVFAAPAAPSQVTVDNIQDLRSLFKGRVVGDPHLHIFMAPGRNETSWFLPKWEMVEPGSGNITFTAVRGGPRFDCNSNFGLWFLGNHIGIVIENFTIEVGCPPSQPAIRVHAINKKYENSTATLPTTDGVVIRNCVFRNININGSQGDVGAIPAAVYIIKSMVRFENCTFEHLRGFGGGAIIASMARLEVVNCTFRNTTAVRNGGAIAFYGGVLVIEDSTFIDTRALASGGALHSTDFSLNIDPLGFAQVHLTSWAASTVTITRTTFEGCSAVEDGGGVFYAAKQANTSAPVLMSDCTFVRCSSGGLGGGVALTSVSRPATPLSLLRLRMSGCSALAGGSLSIVGARVSAQRVDFGNSTATSTGGCMALLGSQLLCDGCTLEQCRASFGGGVHISSGRGSDVALRNSTLAGCSATVGGGGIYAEMQEQAVRLQLNRTQILNGAASTGGAVHLSCSDMAQGCSYSQHQCAMTGNRARTSGGALLLANVANVTIHNSTLASNEAVQSGGGIFLYVDDAADAGSSVRITLSTLADNSGQHGGAAALRLGKGAVLVDTCNLNDNRAELGGALWLEDTPLQLTGSVLGSNRASGAGGALAFSKQSSVNATGSTFVQNTAALGGAVAAHASALLMAACDVRDNQAGNGQGGALVAWAYPWQQGAGGAVFLADGSYTLDNTTMVANTAAGDGGALTLVESSGDVRALNCSRNAAQGAGGCIAAFTSTQQLRVAASNMSRNSAGRGGAIAAQPHANSTDDGRLSGEVELVGTAFLSNMASDSGGAVAVNRSRQLTVLSCRMTDNAADQHAGALSCLGCGSASLTDTAFVSNAAASCGAASFVQCAGSVAVNGSVFDRNSAANASVVAADSVRPLPAWDSPGSGGALCFISGSNATIAGSKIVGNTATYGGAMYLGGVEDALGNQEALPRGSVHILPSTTISGNQAFSDVYTRTAGAVVAPNAAALTQGGSNAGNPNVSLATAPHAVVALPVASSRRRRDLLAVSPSDPDALLLDSSGNIPALQASVLDELRQGLPSTMAETLSIEASAQDAKTGEVYEVYGLTSLVQSGDAAVFSGMRLEGPPGATLLLRLAVPQASDVRAGELRVQKDLCGPGQALDTSDGRVRGCTNCTQPLFSFDPNSPEGCQRCPGDGVGVCSGNTLIPASGFYQSHPRSMQLHACTLLEGCRRDAAAQAGLMAMQQQLTGSGTNITSEQVAAYQQQQCTEGYTGHLCETCESSASNRFGKVFYRCLECTRSRALDIALYCLARVIDLGIITLMIFLLAAEGRRRVKSTPPRCKGPKEALPTLGPDALPPAATRVQTVVHAPLPDDCINNGWGTAAAKILADDPASYAPTSTHTSNASEFSHATSSNSASASHAPRPTEEANADGGAAPARAVARAAEESESSSEDEQSEEVSRESDSEASSAGPVRPAPRGALPANDSTCDPASLDGANGGTSSLPSSGSSHQHSTSTRFFHTRSGEVGRADALGQQLSGRQASQALTSSGSSTFLIGTTGAVVKTTPSLQASVQLPKQPQDGTSQPLLHADDQKVSPREQLLLLRPLLSYGDGASGHAGRDAEGATPPGVFLEALIEFCQLLFILRLVLVEAEWSGATHWLYNIVTLPGAATQSLVSFECMLPPGTPPAERAYWWLASVLLTPVVYVALAWAGVALTLALQMRRQPHNRNVWWRLLAPHMVVCALVVASFCYPSFTNAAASLFSCRSLDAAPASERGEVVDASGARWTLDLHVQCFVGTHLVLALAVGVPALLLAVAYPLALWGWLRSHARKGDLQQGTRFWKNYAHMWAPYRSRLYGWSAVREARKLALVAIVLGLRLFGGLAQLLGAVVVMFLALGTHSVLTPFTRLSMTTLQAALLGAVLLTVWLNLLIAVLPLNQGAQLALQIAFVVVDGCMVLLLLGLLCWAIVTRTRWGVRFVGRASNAPLMRFARRKPRHLQAKHDAVQGLARVSDNSQN